ncbi:MAG: ABC transporter permease subunit [Rhodoblastus sp.]
MRDQALLRSGRRPLLVGLASLMLACGLWQALVIATGAQRFPSFTATLSALSAQIPILASEAGITIARAAIGLGMATVVMIPLGVFIARTRILLRLFEPIVNLMRPLPPLALVPIVMLFAGPGSAAKIWTIFYGASIPILINTMDGVRDLDPMMTQVARSLRLTRLERLALLDLRAASPRIVAGVRLALAASLLIAISTEMLLSADGLGSYIVRAQESFRIADGMAALLFIAILSLAINSAAGWADHRLLAWHYLRRDSGDS